MTTKTTASVAALFVLIATGTAVKQTRSAHESSLKLEAATQRLDEANAEIAALRSHLANAEAKPHGRSSEPSRTKDEENAPTGSTSTQSSGSTERSSATGTAQNTPPPTVDDVVMTDPGFQELHLKEFAAGLPVTYAALYRKLKLTPEQRAQFESIMVEQRRSILDAGVAAKTQGLSVANPGLSTVDQEIIQATSQKLFALLGRFGVEELNRFDTTAESKVVELAGRLYSGGIPLTTEQGDALNRILIENTTKEKRQGLTGDGDKLNQEMTLAQAEKILLPEQFSLFRSMLMTDTYRQQANDRALLLLRTQGRAESVDRTHPAQNKLPSTRG